MRPKLAFQPDQHLGALAKTGEETDEGIKRRDRWIQVSRGS